MIATITRLLKIFMREKFGKKFQIGTFVLIRNATKTEKGVRLEDSVAMIMMRCLIRKCVMLTRKLNGLIPILILWMWKLQFPRLKKRYTVVDRLQKIGDCVSTSTTTMRTLWMGQGAQSISLKLWGENTGIPISGTGTQIEIANEIRWRGLIAKTPSILLENKVYQCPHTLLEKEFPWEIYVPKTVKVWVVGTQVVKIETIE
ncbi:hypothetical protein ScPMuIL_008247 [Solemya velum]